MRITRPFRLGVAIAALSIVATACGGGEEARTISSSAENGSLIVGIKFDQPGL
ncbi:MAG: glutamate-binding protein, partial [Actinobacteria bacterium]|nr:glutamate-binding protein [Actinomycetota bacterium]